LEPKTWLVFKAGQVYTQLRSRFSTNSNTQPIPSAACSKKITMTDSSGQVTTNESVEM
jgi:hypothetical protein